MKRLFGIILCLLVTASLAVTAMAAGELGMAAQLGSNTVHRGETVTLSVTIGEHSGKSGGINVAVNSSVLKVVPKGTGEEWVVEGALLKEFSQADEAGKYIGTFVCSADKAFSGNVFTCTLKVKNDAPFGVADIQLTVKIGNTTETKTVKLNIVCNHNFGGWTADEGAPTHTHVCTICNTPETVEHTWNGGEITTASTCAAEGVKTFTCTGCGAQKTEAVEKVKHKYDNSCDTTCNACGAERKTSHKYSDKYTSDESGHWYQCTVCKAKKDVAAHKPGAEPTEQTSQNCTVCGFIIQSALGHTHDYQLEWSADETGHWHACNGCDNQHELAEHAFDGSCDQDCNICGYQRETEHIFYQNYLSDESGHWHECRICGYQLEKEYHIPNENGMCTGCGYKTQAADHEHGYGDDWTWDVAGHWQTCECGHSSDTEPHSWDNGRIAKKPTDTEDGARTYKCTICGAQKSEIIPMGTVITDSFPWVVLLIVGGTMIVGVVIFVIVGIVKGKKNAGKFGEHMEQQEMTEV